MIHIEKTPSADSRSTKKPIAINELREQTEAHIGHVQSGLRFISERLQQAGRDHDHTKLTSMGEFHAALLSGKVKNSEWYGMHITEERHHLKSKVPEDVTLIDVLEHVTDCVMAGLARSGDVYDVDLDPRLLQKALENTVALLKKNTIVGDASKEDLLDEKI